MNHLRRRLGFPSPALILSFVALSISMGAVAFAATKAPKNSVVGSSVKNEALTAKDVKDGSLTGGELADGSVTGADIDNNSLGGNDIDESSLQLQAATSATPSGAAGGDLTGEYPNPTITAGAVTAAKVADGAIEGAKLADGSVSGAKIADGAVATGKIADNAVTAAKIPTDAVGNSELGASAVFSSNILNGQVNSDDVLNDGLTGDDVDLDIDVVSATSANNSNAFKVAQANCAGGRIAVGGGAYILESDSNQQPLIALIDSNLADADSYSANANEIGAGTPDNWQLQATVVCLDL